MMNQTVVGLYKRAAEFALEAAGDDRCNQLVVDSITKVKFAELIVRECCQLIDDSTPVYSPENLQEDYCQGKLDGYRSALLEIKDHFGIE